MEQEKKRKPIFYGGIALLGIMIIVTVYSMYTIYDSSKYLAERYGTGITTNWAESMTWLKENTPQCTVVATYWDPGYWINALSERKTIYDGGSQNSIRKTPLAELNGLDCITDRKGYITEEEGVSYCVTSRMQDMAGSLYTSDEIWAAKVLESYMGDCNDLYFLASNDLIGKSQWWTYFSNWDPEAGKGTAYPYAVVGFQEQKELMYENGTALIYGPFYIKITFENNMQSVEPLLLQSGRYYKIENMVIIQNNTPIKLTYANATVKGTLWVDPSMQLVIYMDPHTENSMFTRMFFYNGEGLNYFEPAYLNSEVKLFKFNVEKFREDLEAGLI